MHDHVVDELIRHFFHHVLTDFRLRHIPQVVKFDELNYVSGCWTAL